MTGADAREKLFRLDAIGICRAVVVACFAACTAGATGAATWGVASWTVATGCGFLAAACVASGTPGAGSCGGAAVVVYTGPAVADAGKTVPLPANADGENHSATTAVTLQQRKSF
jgi:hypothetical protein